MESPGLIKREKARPLILFVFLTVGFFLPASTLAQQAVPPAKAQEIQAQAQPEKIVAAFQNIKESSRTYVFLGWMWLSIAVLIYFLRLKIKEADRLYEIKFFSPDKK
jgi:hypothetical protein